MLCSYWLIISSLNLSKLGTSGIKTNVIMLALQVPILFHLIGKMTLTITTSYKVEHERA